MFDDIELLATNRRMREAQRRNVCSACGNSVEHNSRIGSGLDARRNLVLAGECCIHHVCKTFGRRR
jgi:hypothetical protein